MYNPVVPWSEIRVLVDLEYLPDIYEYLHKIPCEDLRAFEDYCRMQRYEQEQLGAPLIRNDADWSDKLKVTMVELEYRRVNQITVKGGN